MATYNAYGTAIVVTGYSYQVSFLLADQTVPTISDGDVITFQEGPREWKSSITCSSIREIRSWTTKDNKTFVWIECESVICLAGPPE